MPKRAIVLVLDGCGAGPAPDAEMFNDFDQPSTIHNVWKAVGGINAPVLSKLGFFSACGVPDSELGLDGFVSTYGRLQEMSMGKDSVTGHWEMMGVHTETPFPTYPNGFPEHLVQAFEERIGAKVLGNKPASGTAVLNELGAVHMATGNPILYTSADSVFQVACHEEVVPIERLYEMCRIAREICSEPNNVQRVIARPFLGNATDGFQRTERRKDFPLPAPANFVDHAKDVFGIGVIPELFDGRNFRPVRRTQSNPEHALMLTEAMSTDARFIFCNFEDFDMLYGHRNDPQGFARCLESFDVILKSVLDALTEEDLLILTADHGNDPTSESTDHSREYVPFVTTQKGATSAAAFGDQQGLWNVGSAVAGHLGLPFNFPSHE